MAEVKTVWVQAHFKEIGEWSTERVQVRTEIRTVEKGIFNKKLIEEEVPVFEDKRVWNIISKSNKEIDGNRLTADVGRAIAALVTEGYQISCVIPVISGEFKNDFQNTFNGFCYGWGYGYSFTEGVTVICTKD